MTTHTIAIPGSCSTGEVTVTLVYRPAPAMFARERGWDAKDHVRRREPDLRGRLALPARQGPDRGSGLRRAPERRRGRPAARRVRPVRLARRPLRLLTLHGRPVVLDLSALGCGSCKELAAWLGGEPSSHFDGKPEYAGIPQRVAAGELDWITIVFEDGAGDAATPEHAALWAEAFPNPKVAVLADNDRAMFDCLYPGSYPSLLVLDEDMTFRIYDRFDYGAALTSLAQ